MALCSLGVFIALGCPSEGYAQGNRFGPKIATTLYQPQFETSQDFPGLGVEAGFASRFPVGRIKLTHLQAEFGYLMGNTPTDAGAVKTNLSFRAPIGPIVDAHFLIHMANAGLYLLHNFTPEENFGLFAGPEVNYLLGNTLVIEYQTGPDNTNTEFIGGNLQNANGEEIDRVFVNLRWGMEIRMFKQAKPFYKLYLGFMHQVDERPWFPTGALAGLKIYLPPKLFGNN